MLCALKVKPFFRLQNETYKHKSYLPSWNTAYMDQGFPAKSLDFQPTSFKRKI